MTEFPGGRDMVCPAWCELPAGHLASVDYEEQRHLRAVAEIGLPEIDGIRAGGEGPVSVWLEGWVDWEGKEWPPVVTVSLSGGCDDGRQDLTAAEARALAAALERAAGLLDGSQPPG